jgi:hypothetical protein
MERGQAMRTAERWVTRPEARRELTGAVGVLAELIELPEQDELVTVSRDDLDIVLRELCGSPAAWRAALRLVDEVRL